MKLRRATKRKNRLPVKVSRFFALLPAVSRQPSEKLSPAAQNLIQRFLKVRRSFSKFTTNLLDVFLITLLDLLAEKLPQGAVPDSLIALLRMIRDQIRNKCTREPARTLARIGLEERVDGPARTLAANRCIRRG